MKRSVLFTFFIGYTVCLFAQVPIKVLDAKTLKPLVGANVYIDRKDGIAVTDSNGVFSISDNIDLTENDTIVVSFVGYVSQHFTLSGIRKRSTILLFEKVESLEEVSVFGRMDMNLRLPYVEFLCLKRLYSFASIIEGDSIYVIGGDESQVSILNDKHYVLHAKPNILFKNNGDKLYIYDISSDRWITKNVYSRNALIRLLLAMKTVFMY
ncbi:MAG: carboxypeptidase-like regulatory domain-containing protein [Bacteroides sp.]